MWGKTDFVKPSGVINMILFVGGHISLQTHIYLIIKLFGITNLNKNIRLFMEDHTTVQTPVFFFFKLPLAIKDTRFSHIIIPSLD